MFGFGNGSYYDSLRDIYGDQEAFKRYEDQCGKLLIATANNDGDTRLFVRSINFATDQRKKNGWWNTFTITRKPCDAGTYICKVLEVKADKNGYPIFVATPVVTIPEHINCCPELMYLFGISGMFIEDAGSWNGEYNHQFLAEQINAIKPVVDIDGVNHYVAVAQEAVRLFINGAISRDQVVIWLHEPSDWQKEEERFKEEVLRFFNQDLEAMMRAKDLPALMEPTFFPLTAEKCLKFKADRTYIWPDNKVEFVRDLISKYEAAVNKGQIDAVNNKSIWHQIEAYLEFDNARKKAKKAEKTAAKKAKKAAVKTGIKRGPQNTGDLLFHEVFSIIIV
jgi:hypothetical protein